jgi:hypothetical protein
MAVLMAERIERPPSLFGPGPEVRAPAPGNVARGRDGDLGGELTLDDAIVGAWEGLAAQVVVACPLCDGPLRPHAAPDEVGGRCGDCGTTLG